MVGASFVTVFSGQAKRPLEQVLPSLRALDSIEMRTEPEYSDRHPCNSNTCPAELESGETEPDPHSGASQPGNTRNNDDDEAFHCSEQNISGDPSRTSTVRSALQPDDACNIDDEEVLQSLNPKDRVLEVPKQVTQEGPC